MACTYMAIMIATVTTDFVQIKSVKRATDLRISGTSFLYGIVYDCCRRTILKVYL